jgi:hypothetical protein
MVQKNKLMKVIERWPLALVIFGLALTVIWLIALLWVPLYLLQIV